MRRRQEQRRCQERHEFRWRLGWKWISLTMGPNVEVTGAARLYRAASGGPQG